MFANKTEAKILLPVAFSALLALSACGILGQKRIALHCACSIEGH